MQLLRTIQELWNQTEKYVWGSVHCYKFLGNYVFPLQLALRLAFSLYSWRVWWASSSFRVSALARSFPSCSHVYTSPGLCFFVFCTPLGYENQSSMSLGSANALQVSLSFRILLHSLSSCFHSVYGLWEVLMYLLKIFKNIIYPAWSSIRATGPKLLEKKVSFILQMRKLRFRKAKQLTPKHRVSK